LVSAQNKSYQLFIDSILYRFELDNYETLKNRFLHLEKNFSIDPSNELLLLGLSVQNGDDKFYKKRIKRLIVDHGFTYHYNDTLPENLKTVFYEEIYARNEYDWLVKLSNRKHPKWVKNNPVAAEIESEVETLAEMDQLAVKILTPYSLKSEIPDSIKAQLRETLYATGRSNIDKLKSICERINTFPNNFDFGIRSYYKLGALLDHCFEGNFEYAWENLSPYLEKAYLDGKIDYYFLMAYDMHSSMQFGTQRFGFAPESIPMEDPEGFEERKEKYGL